MRFSDKHVIKERYLLLFIGLIALGSFCYGVGLRAGQAFGLFLLSLLIFFVLIGFTIIWDKVDKMQVQIDEMEESGGEPYKSQTEDHS